MTQTPNQRGAGKGGVADPGRVRRARPALPVREHWARAAAMNRCYQYLVFLGILCVSCCGAGEADTAKMTETQGSPNPGENLEMLEAQLKNSTNSVEKAQLEEALGQLYSYRTGLVDYPKALVHLTVALRYELPEQTYIELLMLRGNCEEFLGNKAGALRDYLRGLLACSYHELSGGCTLPYWLVVKARGTAVGKRP